MPARAHLPLSSCPLSQRPPRPPCTPFFSFAQRVARFRHGARCFSWSRATIFLWQRLRGHALPLQWPRDRNFSRGRHPFPCYPAIFFLLASNAAFPSFVFFHLLFSPNYPHPNFSNFSTGFFFPSLTTTPSHAIHLAASLLSCLSFSCLCYPLNESDDDD